ncbi:MAG: metal ABC transporter permease [Firmicutes bacterium GWF2_51_9]|nr:MAG: metal ABC transporter permease [Firmicutes bacterium GWF2_51_9]OGS57557.1 MAG: metal ABC transporter permease [Firmicutes bacterium GWE2_51_13]HAM64046.1 metal ABC transporter permease [Erysipelotrichaceae bacterium]HBZ42258.1 metal ABC transporter permease [Erysipelotrichaceae bacterium]
MDLFNYEFMRRALIVGVLVALIVPAIGQVLVLKRMSMVSDALSHVSLAGVAFGLVVGMNPVLSAILACILAVFGLDELRKVLPEYGETAIAVVLSLGIGLAAILSDFTKSGTNFNAFLFGSIVAIPDDEYLLILLGSIVVFTVFLIFYRSLFSVSLDETFARLSGVNVRLVNMVFMTLTALSVSIAAKTVGALIVSSLAILPVLSGMRIAKSYRQTTVYSILFGLFFTVTGLILSFYFGIKPGGAIVLLGVFTYLGLIALTSGKGLAK